MNTQLIDHVLVIGFGSPEKPEDVRSFLQTVAAGRNIPQSRLDQVETQYQQIGGASPYNHQSLDLAAKIEQRLGSLPVFVGMRNWHPFLKDTLQEISSRKLKRGLAIILSPFKSEASFDRYQQNVEEAKREIGNLNLSYEYLEHWENHPLFLEAQQASLREAIGHITQDPCLIFAAHSIPSTMKGAKGYEKEFEELSRRTAESFEGLPWKTGYQSRSGNSQESWLGPDINEVIQGLAGKERAALIVPMGFLCDNAEVLFDLDIQARETAEKNDIPFYRAPTVYHQDQLIEMFVRLIQEKL